MQTNFVHNQVNLNVFQNARYIIDVMINITSERKRETHQNLYWLIDS